MLASNVFSLIILHSRNTNVSLAVTNHVITNDHKSVTHSGIIKTNYMTITP